MSKRITKKCTRTGTRLQLVRCVRTQPRITKTPEYPKFEEIRRGLKKTLKG